MKTFNNFEKIFLKKYSYNIKDTGSTEIQILLLTFKINNLNTHIKNNKKDKDNKNAFYKLTGKRLKFLKYLKRKKINKYEEILRDLKIGVVK